MSPHQSESELDPRFTCDFRQYDDDLRLSNYFDLEPLCRGPEPVPDWVVLDRGAVDSELGVLKTGKEAEVFLLERSGADGTVVMAAKRYRSTDHRDFHRSAAYLEGRRMRNTRDSRAVARKSRHGREVAASQWVHAEWESLKRLWSLGVPVPYPVQVDGTEILMELVTDPDGDPAPRLARARPDERVLRGWWEQLREAMAAMAVAGIAHGDLSPYNVLAAGERLVIIDLPQVVDLVANPTGADFLMRDCRNMCDWFRSRGLDVDEQELFAELLLLAY